MRVGPDDDPREFIDTYAEVNNFGTTRVLRAFAPLVRVAAVRALAAQRRGQDTERGILLAAVCPGMINTPTSAMWWDVSTAPTPAQAAVALLNLALEPATPGHYGQLVRNGKVLPWTP